MICIFVFPSIREFRIDVAPELNEAVSDATPAGSVRVLVLIYVIRFVFPFIFEVDNLLLK